VESYEADAGRQDRDAQEALGGYIAAALELSRLKELTGREGPTVVT
jgi:phosphoglucomutase